MTAARIADPAVATCLALPIPPLVIAPTPINPNSDLCYLGLDVADLPPPTTASPDINPPPPSIELNSHYLSRRISYGFSCFPFNDANRSHLLPLSSAIESSPPPLVGCRSDADVVVPLTAKIRSSELESIGRQSPGIDRRSG